MVFFYAFLFYLSMDITSVDVLERKGVLTSEEWEKEVKAKVENAAKTTQSFREMES